ncbi:MAG: hypothetical protein V4488_25910 [Pseudomonadota bacterium]
MNSLKVLALALAIWLPRMAQAADPLILNEIHQTEGAGKLLDLRVEEVSRDARTSTVEIVFVSGASVASSLFIMRAIYDIAKARGDRYCVKLSESTGEQGKSSMLIGFSKEKVADIDDYYQTGSIAKLSTRLEQIDLNMYDMLFKPRTK